MSSLNFVVNQLYLSCACNCKAQAFDYCNNIVAYPSSKSVILYNLKSNQCENILNNHIDQVNCVKWIESELSLLTCSSDHNAIIWHKDENWKPLYKLSGHQNDLITGHSILVYFSPNLNNHQKIYFTCTSSNDETLKIWLNNELIESYQTHQFVFDVKLFQDLSFIPDESVLIFYAGSDTFIYLLLFNLNKKISPIIKLSGHRDWVRSLDILKKEDVLYLASGSQDNFIRVFKITQFSLSQKQTNEQFFNINKSLYSIILDTVLLGHEGWVFSVKWTKSKDCFLMLLSSSMDKSLILWKQQNQNDILTEDLRVGDIGGNNFGFIGALITNDHNTIIGQSYSGALHIWCFNKESKFWQSSTPIGGHSKCVTDISWDPKGNYLLSCSLDQTTRLHGRWFQKESISWHEIGRPQMHGYDLNCLTALDSLTFVSGADEKVLRIFKATKSFVKSIQNISCVNLLESFESQNELAEFATFQPLGLSSRAVFDRSQGNEYFKSIELKNPPSEEILVQNTLWSEFYKLYGHGYEIFAVACNRKVSLLATACKASKSDDASIIIWNVLKNFKEITRLKLHQLTVTQLKFSPSDEFLLSCSRDRTWALCKIYYSDSDFFFEKLACSDKKTGIHSRIIWDISWTPDSKYFITASRDKKAIFWSVLNGKSNSSLGPVKTVPNGEFIASDSINTIDFADFIMNNCYIIAMGLENGVIIIYSWTLNLGWNHLKTISSCHVSAIRRVRFKPGNDKSLTLASCGDDCKVIIFCLTQVN